MICTDLSNVLLNSTREACGETKERRQGERETCRWNEKVQLAVREKKLAFKRWQSEGNKKCTSSTERKIGS